MHDPLGTHELIQRASAARLKRTAPPDEIAKRRGDVEISRRMKRAGFVVKYCAEFGVTESYRILQNGLEHRFQLTQGAADNLQHLGRRGLLLLRFAQLPPSLLKFALKES